MEKEFPPEDKWIYDWEQEIYLSNLHSRYPRSASPCGVSANYVGYKVEFDKSAAKIIEKLSGKEIGHFPRSHGLYFGKLELRNPAATSTFPRQA